MRKSRRLSLPGAEKGTRAPWREATARGEEPRARAQRAKRNRRKPDWLRALLSGLLFLLGAECIWAAFHSPRLAVQRIVVTGSTTLTSEQVAAMAGIRVGENIFRTNLFRIRQAIRSAPAIREANVARLLPATLAIQVVEREARLILLQGARYYEVDAEGVVFREVPPRKAALGSVLRAPRYSGSLSAPVTDDPRLSTRSAEHGARSGSVATLVLRPGLTARLGETLPRPIVEAALHCVRLARAEGLMLRKMSIDAHGDLWLNVAVAGASSTAPLSLPIRVGRSEELGAKFADTRHVLQHAPRLAAVAQYLDVSCPRRPAYRVAAEDSRSAVALTQ
jgi:cell division protein FtsQ